MAAGKRKMVTGRSVTPHHPEFVTVDSEHEEVKESEKD